MQDFEKLGAFYLGRRYDLAHGQRLDDLLLYDSKDLTTHAVCVGMTGSGKTGLCLSLLEEAAIDGIPAIAIDPKGDLGNLLLTFPELQPGDFQPWIDSAEAARAGVTVEQFAAQQADTWRKGLADWGQDAGRIAKFGNSAERTIYTPGSTAGLPLTVLRSFSAPSPAVLADADALRERINSATAGLLGLLGIDADPIRSREHILVANVFDQAWRSGRDLQLAGLIREIQSPPFDRVGVVDLETFYPSKERFALAMSLNNLLASPGFANWLEGEPLDVQRLLYTAAGKPRLTILSLAHLSDAERMFFVTILLNEVLAWMRSQPGTSSLRALLYMDEVFGYFPPTANPPSKTPMLTLLKQARAFGLGVVLATQNPVDLDYKGLSNAGTWFLGRLQTERDKARVLEGLEGAAAQAGGRFDRAQMEVALAALGRRVFLMNNTHEDGPVVFQTRWTLSYLRGPLTRQQIAEVMKQQKAAAPATAVPAAAVAGTVAAAPTPPVSPPSAGPTAAASPAAPSQRPLVPPEVTERFLARKSAPAGTQLVYRPALLGTARLHYVEAKTGVDEWRSVVLLAHVGSETPADVWQDAERWEDGEPECDAAPEPAAAFATLPPGLAKPKSYAAWAKSLKDACYRDQPLKRWSCPTLKLVSQADEAEAEFRVHVRQAAREQRDAQVEKLRKRYAPKLRTLADRMRTAEDRLRREQSQAQQGSLDTMLSLGGSVLGALFGRKLASVSNVTRAARAVKSVGRSMKERGDVSHAEDEVAHLRDQLAALEDEFQKEVAAIEAETNPDELPLAAALVRPRKADIAVGPVVLAWVPWNVDAQGAAARGC
jgi:hypothetical protein